MAGKLISSADRQLLEEYCQKTTSVLSRRANLILLYDDGLLTHQAAEQAGFSRSQARYWKHQFLMDGMKIFPDLEDQSFAKNNVEEEIIPTQGSDEAVPSLSVKNQMETTELPFPGVMKRPGILPNDTLAEAGRKVWLFQFAEMIQKESSTRLGEDIEGLHDMRVATRRMRAAYDVFGSAFAKKTIRRHLKGLRATGRALGKVRDMDVLIEKLINYQNTLKESEQGGCELLIDAWRLDRERGRQAMILYLDSQQYAQFKKEFNLFVQTPGEGVQQATRSSIRANLVCEIVPALIYTRMGAVRAYDSILQNASDQQLHALRIEFKKLRYAVEYFREVLGDEAAQVIQDLKLLQDHLGDFHDAVVACDLVTGFLKDWENSQRDRPLIERQNPERIVNYLAHLHAERHRLLVTLPEVWNHFNRPDFRSNLAKAIAVL